MIQSFVLDTALPVVMGVGAGYYLRSCKADKLGEILRDFQWLYLQSPEGTRRIVRDQLEIPSGARDPLEVVAHMRQHHFETALEILEEGLQ